MAKRSTSNALPQNFSEEGAARLLRGAALPLPPRSWQDLFDPQSDYSSPLNAKPPPFCRFQTVSVDQLAAGVATARLDEELLRIGVARIPRVI